MFKKINLPRSYQFQSEIQPGASQEQQSSLKVLSLHNPARTLTSEAQRGENSLSLLTEIKIPLFPCKKGLWLT
jgi:hypothetical protein